MACGRRELENLCIYQSLWAWDAVTSLSLTTKDIPSPKGNIWNK